MKFHTKLGAVLLGLVVAGGIAVTSIIPSAHAARFNPQPDPPGFANHSILRGAHGPQLDSFNYTVHP